MEKGKNIFIGLCVVIIAILATLLTLSLTGVLNIKEPNDNNIVGKNEDNDEENNEEEQNEISYNIVSEPVSGGLPMKKLYVNKKLVTFQGSNIDVKQLNDILIVEVSYASSALYAVDKEANIIGVFVSEDSIFFEGFEGINKIITKEHYRDTYRIDGNDLYVTTDRLAQDPIYVVCNRTTNDEDIVIYEEKFTYLGNNKFSKAEVVNTVTRKQYMQEHNISCNN